MTAKKPRVLKVRYGKAQGRLTAEDVADLAAAQEGLRQMREHPETLIPAEEVKRALGLK
jgi:hypothetical protein